MPRRQTHASEGDRAESSGRRGEEAAISTTTERAATLPNSGQIIPPLIKRNTALLALSQSFTGAGMQFAYGFGPLMVVQLTGSSALAGSSIALIGLSRFLIAYPIGRITDVWGRKPGIMLGLVIALVGSIVTGLSMSYQSIWMLLAGMLIFAAGMNAAQQLRVAATDMFPPHRRAEALGYVAFGSVAGLILSPFLTSIAEKMAATSGADPLGLPWLMVPALILPGMVMVLLVKPDPKEIGMNLRDYYPGLPANERGAAPPRDFSWREMLQVPELRLALVANAAAQGNMTIVMVLTSLVLHGQGYSLTEIALSHMFHTIGMFAFTIPLGRLADRIGRRRVMLPGVAVALFGAGLVAFTSGWWLVTVGTYLVGVGWAAANVAASATIADAYPSEQRGRAIGVNETAAGAMNMACALVTGPIMAVGGLPWTGAAALIVAIPPLLMAAPWLMGGTRSGK